MSADAQSPSPPTDPYLPRANTAMPAALGRVLLLVRKLIDYGKQLAGTVQQRAAAPGFALFAKPFGTADLAAVLARITSGLRRAAALEAALCCRAARGRDLTPSSIRMPDIRGPRPARLVAPPDAPPEPEPANHTEAPRLARLPTEDEIAAEVRRRPVGAVIADICRDFGIVPSNPLWRELSLVIIENGGNLATLFKDTWKRLTIWLTDPPAAVDPATPAPDLPFAVTPGTGPP